VKKFCP